MPAHASACRSAVHPPHSPTRPRTVPRCSDHARGIPGKAQLFINAFARALEVIPRQLADNSGFDATGAQQPSQAGRCWLHAAVWHGCVRIEAAPAERVCIPVAKRAASLLHPHP